MERNKKYYQEPEVEELLVFPTTMICQSATTQDYQEERYSGEDSWN